MERTLEQNIQSEATRAYSTLLDINAYRNLLSKKLLLEPYAFAQEFAVLNALTRHNVETSIGERFNAEFFQETYRIKNNLIVHPSFHEPFIKVMRRGQKYRRDNGSNDLERENAEVIGFEKVQDLLTRPGVPADEKIIVISPRGSKNSIYQHNYFDVYQKGYHDQVTMSRYACKLSNEEFYEAARVVGSLNDLPENPNDSDFLTNPLVTYKSIEDIRQIFSPQEDTMSRQKYEQLVVTCTPLIINFLNNLSLNPNEYGAEIDYNRILKFAHIYTGLGPQTYDDHTRSSIVEKIHLPQSIQSVSLVIDAQVLPQVKTGCGISGQSSNRFKNIFRPFSVADFAKLDIDEGEDKEEVTDFQCPGVKADGTKCTYIVKAYSGTTKCPECGMEATCA